MQPGFFPALAIREGKLTFAGGTMIRLISFTALLFVLSAATSRGVPAVPLYVPKPTRPQTVLPAIIKDMRGTAWLGKYSAATRTYIFEPDGTLSYKTTTKTIYKNRGSWRLEGDTLIFTYWTTPANKLMDFRGTVKDFNSIVGEATLRTGAKSMQTLKRTGN